MISSATLLVRVPLMVASEILTAAAGLVTTAVCGHSESRPDVSRSGVPVLLLHGSGFNQSEWLGVKAYLSADRRVGPVYTVNYAYLLSGDKAATIQDYVARKVMPKIRAIFAECGREQVILVGHSLGGLIGAETARQMDEVLKVITICSPFGGVPLLSHCCRSSMTDEQMRVDSAYLTALRGAVQEHPARYFHIGSRTDFIVPPERAVAVRDPKRRRIFDGIEGHWGIVASPRVWAEIKKSILEN